MKHNKNSNVKKPVPSRLCRDAHTKYCTGQYGHRGCCACWEANHGDPGFSACQPYYLDAYAIEMGWDLDD